ncbi:MAG: carboxypeptidase-like regulatory domain-containing protein [Candidatus Thermoplasmatota archaeon]
MAKLSVALALIVLVLSGCTSGGGGETADTASLVAEEEFEEYEATADTGVIRGVVIDEAIRPLMGAEVRLSITGGDKNTTTSESGAFGFEGLEPGQYFIQASKVGYKTMQANTEVVAGDSEPPVTKILLVADPASVPYVIASQYSGYIECSFRVAVPGVTSVGVNACNGVGNQDVNMPLAPFDKIPTFVQGEMVWTSTQTLGSGLSFVVGPPNCDDFKYSRADGESPLIIGLNTTKILESSLDYDSDTPFDPETGICYRAFSYVAAETLGALGVVTSQQFEVFWHSFYGFEPAEGWNFSEDGAPTVP